MTRCTSSIRIWWMKSGTLTGPGLYCELHAHSTFSLLDGVPFPEELAERAAELRLPALALTDHDALYGVVPFYTRARALGVKPIIGVELTVERQPAALRDDDASGGQTTSESPRCATNNHAVGSAPQWFHLTLLAADQAGYRNLCQLISLARAGRTKGQAALLWDQLPQHAPGLLCLTGCQKGPVAAPLLAAHPRAGDLARQALDQLQTIFGRENLYMELQRHLCRSDKRLTHWLAALAHEYKLKCVATGNVHYLSHDDADLQDVLVSIRERVPLPQAGRLGSANPLRPNHEFYLRSPAAMAALYPDLPEALTNTLEVAERCNVALPMGLQVLPTYPIPPGRTTHAYLRTLCEQALPRCYPESQKPRRGIKAKEQARALLEKELKLIEQLGLANYFLVVSDIINFCKKRGILCHGRGSAANSLVAHLLGISAVDPIEQELVVERFLSVEHGGTPDIDLDIDAARREAVIQYVYDRWGRDHAAMACTYVTFRSASAIRDAGFALGFKPETIERLAGVLESERCHTRAEPGAGHVPDHDGRLEPPDVSTTAPDAIAGVAAIADRLRVPNNEISSAQWQQLLDMAARLQKRPRHLGLHNGGMIVTGEPLNALIPIEPATMEDRTVVQFDKTYLEESGIVKIDLLGLRMLSAIADTIDLVRQGRGETIDLARLDQRDKDVYDQICSAQTIGIFQVESGAQVSIIPHLQPRCFQDLVIEISLIRPGPLQGNMVRPYIRRRQGLEPVTYPHASLVPALKGTLGVIVFQEQVIKIARDLAGFTPGRGELLRRALGHKYAAEELEKFKADFIAGALGQGVGAKIAEGVWQMIANFAGYSFSQAHAASFAVIVYWSAWLRVHYPTEYFCGLLRASPLGTYPAHVLESEARRVGVQFLPFDINRSLAKATVERLPPEAAHPTSAGGAQSVVHAIRFGLDFVRGLGEERAQTVVDGRGARPFRSLGEFVKRTCTPEIGLDRRAVESLVLAGAFDTFGERRQLLWDLAEAFEVARRPAPQLALDVPDERARMLPMTAEQKLMRAFASTGVTAGPHLIELRRDAFTRANCQPFRELAKLRAGVKVKVGGLVADGLRRPPTSKGTSFLRLEDPDGMVDV